jgi:energy-coupling factor transporter ATP-binding protein EcfA2
MPVRIRAKNFQSLEDAELVVDKLTVVTGANNSGKTALMRAVRGVFTNASTSTYLRHGTEELSVTVDFLDGKTVTWKRGLKIKPTYHVDGKTLYPGREVPQEVHDLGVKPIAVGTGAVWPQVAQQMTGTIFLLDMSGSNMAEAVADVNRVSKLTAALRFAESDKRSATADLKVRRKDLGEAEKSVQHYASLPPLADRGRAVLTQHAQAQALATVAIDAAKMAVRVQGFRTTVQAHSWVVGFAYPSQGDVLHVATSTQAVQNAKTLRTSLGRHRQTVQALDGIASVEVPPTPVEALEGLRTLATTRDMARKVRTARAALQDASKAANKVDPDGWSTLNQGLPKLEKVVAVLGSTVALRTRLGVARNAVDALLTALEASNADFDATSDEVAYFLDALGQCPTCGSAHTGPVHVAEAS